MGCCCSAPENDNTRKTLLTSYELDDLYSPVNQPPPQINNPMHLQMTSAQPSLSQQVQPFQDQINQPPSQTISQPPTQTPSQPILPNAKGVIDSNSDAFSLLLCGTGEGGKTTFIRQLKIKYLGGIAKEEKESLVQTIRGNVVETMQKLIEWAEKNDMEISSEFDEDKFEISDLNAFDCKFTPELAEKLKQLWEDPAIQEAFQHKDETIIPDHMDYFYSKIDELVNDDYIPSDDDALRARVRSIGIDQITLFLDGALIRIYDMGGQKNERNKWKNCKNEIEGVIFCVSLVDYDKPCFEDTSNLRMNDAIDFFKEITHTEMFKEAPFFLVFNKYDTFPEKVTKTDTFVKIFPDFLGDQHDPKAVQDFIIQKFMEASNPPIPSRPITVYTQSSLNSDQVANTANHICEYIHRNYFEDNA